MLTPDLITPHFSWSREARCHDGTEVPDGLRPNIIHLCAQLEVLRADLGEPIIVNDMYRTAAHNAAVGGADHSQHMLGRAADVRCANATPAAIKAAVERLIADGKMDIGGIGIYPGFVHLDTRLARARWIG